MKQSEPLYAIGDNEEFKGIVWDTELGKIVTLQGAINPQMDLYIYDIKTNQKIDNIDLRNVLMSILTIK